MLTKLAVTAAAIVIAAGTIAYAPTAFHQAADLQQADATLLSLSNPGAIAAPNAGEKLADAGQRLQKVAGIAPRPKAQAAQWVSADQWGQH